MSDSQENQATIRRSKHDRKNPYVMISREMLQDSSISPAAKGVLCYLLSLPDDWQIYHGHLQKSLCIGKDALNTCLNELIDNGYAKRERVKIKGQFQPYQYEVSEFKIFFPERENRSGLSAAENPLLHNRHSLSESTKETATANDIAAASFEPPKEERAKEAKPLGFLPVYPCLLDVPIPHAEKEWLTKTYSLAQVEKSLAWWRKDPSRVKQTLQQALKEACKQNYEVPKHEKELSDENKKKAKELVDKHSHFLVEGVRISDSPKYVEFIFDAQRESICIDFEDKSFEEKLMKLIKKYRILNE